MRKPLVVALYRFLFGVLILIAIVAQFMSSSQKIGFDPINFLSFFTIQSNILAATLFLTLAGSSMAQRDKLSTQYIRGGVTLYMSLVGIVYVTLLAGHPATIDTTLSWVNVVLHYVMPLVVLADWILQPPQVRLALSYAVWWLVFPLLYVVYSLLRGLLTSWYPYPFLNVVQHGYAQVLFTCVGISIAVIVGARLLLLSYVRTATHKSKQTTNKSSRNSLR